MLRMDANATRDWRIYRDFAQSLIGIARRLYADEVFGLDLKDTVYGLDATTIDLCLPVFPWAPFRSAKAAVKLHTLLDLRGNIPSFIFISDGKLHDVEILDQLAPEPGAIYVMDRGYIDFDRLGRFHEAGSFFVIRAKTNLEAERRYSHAADRSTGLVCDQTVTLTSFYSQKGFPAPLRRIGFKDPETGKRLVFLSNNFALSALTITQLYRRRWQIELFPRVKPEGMLQVDQAASADQGLFRHDREWGQDADMERGLGLRACRHRQEAARALRQPLRNPTDPEPHHVRANAHKSAAFPTVGRRSRGCPNQPVDFVRLTLGHCWELTNPEPLSVAEVQAQLCKNAEQDRRPCDEAQVLFLDTPEWQPAPEETFIWVVTKTASRWVRSDVGTKALGERVAALRCGLDSTNWTDASGWSEATEDAKRRRQAQMARRERCRSLTGPDVSDNAPPHFDVAKAHELYKALFGGIEDLLRNPDGTAKDLLIVPSGAFTQLPFQVLMTDAPVSDPLALTPNSGPSKVSDPEGLTPIQWLIRRHAITVLPSVASLKALRHNAKASQAARPFVGFGNPLLTGSDGTDKEGLGQAVLPQGGAQAGRRRGGRLDAPGNLRQPVSRRHGGRRGGQALAALPETAGELCAVARELGADEGDVNLGARATETRIRELNAKGALAQARVAHFATHGLVASETRTESVAKFLTEPALMLTPPDRASETDDGLLTASEVTALELDADWVVLSACNTAAGGEAGDAEALSGLARAFFYAGARALLVSHWYVDSQAAVAITTGAFAALKRDPSIGRAEALRRAMLAAMAGTSRPAHWTPAAHPAVWAPFIVVGEGGRGS